MCGAQGIAELIPSDCDECDFDWRHFDRAVPLWFFSFTTLKHRGHGGTRRNYTRSDGGGPEGMEPATYSIFVASSVRLCTLCVFICVPRLIIQRTRRSTEERRAKRWRGPEGMNRPLFCRRGFLCAPLCPLCSLLLPRLKHRGHGGTRRNYT